MALISTLGDVSSTLANIEPGLGAPPLSRARVGYLSVTLNGTVLTNVRSARVSLGFDQAISEASVVLAAEPAGSGTYDDDVSISMGAGPNNVLRFSGLFKQYDRTLWPRSVTLIARGRLSKAAEFKNTYTIAEAAALQSSGIPGVTASELLGVATATDQTLVFAALQRVDGLDVDPANIGGTGTDLGGLPPDALAWGYDETALSFIQKIDSSSQGFRTFESIGGTIYRAQIAGWPGASGTEDFTFTEGLDISDGRSTRTILEQRDTARVDGYDYGIGAGTITFSSTPTSNPKVIQFSTSLAGHINSGAGIGFACEDIANYLLSEWDRELVRITLTTPRDDVIGPGQTHLVTTASGIPDRFGTAEPMWVQHVEISVDEKGRFRQTITYLGGGVADGFDAPIDWAVA